MKPESSPEPEGLLSDNDIARMRIAAINSQTRPGVPVWVYVLFTDGPLDGLRIRVPEADVRAASIAFVVSTVRGSVQAIYRVVYGVAMFVEMKLCG